MNNTLAHPRQGRLDKNSVQKVSRSDMFFAGAGTMIDKAMNVEEAMKLSGNDFLVATGSVFDPDMQAIPDYKRIYRTDTGATLGISGKTFVPIQQAEGMAIGQTIVNDFDANIVVMGNVKGGKQVWAVLEIGESFKIGGEEHKEYMILFNAHTGRCSYKALMTPHRSACFNIVNPSIKLAGREQRLVTIRHTANYDVRVQEARRIMQGANRYYDLAKAQMQSLVEQKFTKQDFEKLSLELFPRPQLTKSGDEPSKRAITNWEDQIAGLTTAYHLDNLNNIRETKYGAFNAVQWYADKGRPVKGDALKQLETMFLRPIEDTGLKDEALVLLTR